MNLENYVCTFEQSKTLKELGIIQRSIFYHKENDLQKSIVRDEMMEWIIKYVPMVDNKFYSAFTSAELGLLLCSRIRINGMNYTFRANLEKRGLWHIKFRTLSAEGKCKPLYQCANKNEAVARAQMLIQLIKKGYLSIGKCNGNLNNLNNKQI